MLRYMLDTDISSYIAKRSNEAVLTKIRTVSTAEVCISAITKCELLYGVEISPRQKQNDAAVQLFLRHVEVMDFPDEACRHYARIRADLRTQGRIIGANDLLIAAHARCLGLTLVTNNTREFSRVPDLLVENWTLTGAQVPPVGQ